MQIASANYFRMTWTRLRAIFIMYVNNQALFLCHTKVQKKYHSTVCVLAEKIGILMIIISIYIFSKIIQEISLTDYQSTI